MSVQHKGDRGEGVGGEGLSSSIEEAIVVQTMSYLDYDEWLLLLIVVDSWGKDGFSGFLDKQHRPLMICQ